MTNRDYLPTPEEIEAAKREIQSTWDERQENMHRAGAYRTREYQTPTVRAEPPGGRIIGG